MESNKNIDKIIGIIIYCFCASLIIFSIISLFNPNWLFYVSKVDKEREMRYKINNAIAYSSNGEDTKAIELYEYVIIKLPTLPEAYSNLGYSYKKLRMYDEALINFKKALENHSMDSSNVYSNMKDIYMIMGNKAQENYCFVMAAKTNTFLIDRYMKEGNFFFNNQSWEQSLASYQKALELRFDMGSYYMDMLNYTYKTLNEESSDKKIIKKQLSNGVNNIDLSIYDLELFKKILYRDNGLALNYNRIGFILAKMNDLENSITYFDNALKINPEYGDALSNREVVTNLLKKNNRN